MHYPYTDYFHLATINMEMYCCFTCCIFFFCSYSIATPLYYEAQQYKPLKEQRK